MDQTPAAPPRFAVAPVAAAALVQAAVLTATSARYGYHRDELYFRLLRPGWGYLDQPPLTPLLAHATRALFGDHLWALRLPATLAAAASVVLVAAIAREAGGGRRAQTLAAWGYAFAAFPLITGHVLLTASVDGSVWLGVLLLIVRAQLRPEPRCWIWAGVLVGVGWYNKLLIVVLLAALAVGVLVTGPRRLLLSRPVLLGVVAAIVVGLPNVVYQAAHGWPQLEFGRQLAAHHAGEVRVSMWPLLLLLLGPPLTLVWVVGTVAAWRRPGWRPIRFLAPALPALLVLVFVMGSQPYYEFGLVGALFGLGCVPLAEWLGRARRGRWTIVVALGAVNAVVDALIALPLVPVAHLGDTPIPGMNQAARDTVGWSAYVDEVASAYHRLPPNIRESTALVASNYGEAGALDLYGPARGLPRVYSGQNQLYFQGRPPESATAALIVGGQADDARRLFRSCRSLGRLDDRVGVDNEEQDEPIESCRHPIGGWRQAWPGLKHED
jgi:4-amino-4-deoxy-L-arabinose transferase-like glycosyltransferase